VRCAVWSAWCDKVRVSAVRTSEVWRGAVWRGVVVSSVAFGGWRCNKRGGGSGAMAGDMTRCQQIEDNC